MEPETIVALISATMSAVVAIVVPVVTFRFALRQDRARWIREQKAQLYVEILTEAYAEQQYFYYETAEPESREMVRFHDLRLPPLERARLGARGTIFASREVNRRFNELQSAAARALLGGRSEAGLLKARMDVESAIEKLQAAVRHELGADKVL